MKKNFVTTAAIIPLFATSCKKNDSPTEPAATHLKRMERSTGHYTIIAYNQQGLPTDLAEIHHFYYTNNDKNVPASAKEKITYPNSPEVNKTIIYTYE